MSDCDGLGFQRSVQLADTWCSYLEFSLKHFKWIISSSHRCLSHNRVNAVHCTVCISNAFLHSIKINESRGILLLDTICGDRIHNCKECDGDAMMMIVMILFNCASATKISFVTNQRRVHASSLLIEIIFHARRCGNVHYTHFARSARSFFFNFD